MAHLSKLAIRGIRSFDDKQIQVMEFFSPVTVIVGHNGSGKTTIIECLKYATTGDQPPNTRGGAFIHDPKMANEKEVKAQVKLRFHAANGKRMLAVRNLSVTVKKTTGLTTKTLESILALADGDDEQPSGGKRGVISTKCAELDSEIPQLLGVSKAVLENVIFCHQEDSYWPLAEPSILKKKFDDIFEATKYTKALEAIKNLRKERMADLKAEKERLDSLAREKGHADKLKTRIANFEREIATKEVQHSDKKKEHEALVLSNKEFYERASKFREAYADLKHLEDQIRLLTVEFERAQQQVSPLEGTEEELEIRLQGFESEINRFKSQRKSEESKLKDFERELQETQDQVTRYSSLRGSLQAKTEAYEASLKEREVLIRDIASQLRMRLDSGPLEQSHVMNFMTQLDGSRRSCLESHGRWQAESNTATNEYNEKLSSLNKVLNTFTVQQTHLQDQISENQRTVSSLEASLENLDDLRRELATLQSDIEDKRARLKDSKTKMVAAQFESKLAEKVAAIRLLNEQKDSLNAEFHLVSSQASARAKLDFRRQEVKSKTAEVQVILDTAGPKFRKVTGSDIKHATMEKDLDTIQRVKEQQKQELLSDATSANRSVQHIELSLSNLKNTLSKKKSELNALRKDLKDALSDPSYPDSLKEAISVTNAEVADRRRVVGQLTGTSEVFQGFLDSGRKTKACPICTQSLRQPAILSSFEAKMSEELRKRSPSVLEEENAEIEDWSRECERLQGYLPVEASIERLANVEIPHLEKEVSEKEALLPSARDKADKATQDLSAIEADLKDIATLRTQSTTITRFHREIETAERETAVLEAQLSAARSTKTADEVQAEIDELSSRIRTAEREKAALDRQREEAQGKVYMLENDINSLALQEAHKSHEVEQKVKSQTHLDELKHSSSTFASQLKDLAVRIKDAEAPIIKLKEEHNAQKEELDEKVAEAARKLQQLNQWIDSCRTLSRPIDSYSKDKIAGKLQECTDQLAQKKGELAQLSGQVKSTQQAIATIDKEINSGGSTLANIRENQRLRRLEGEIGTKQERIKQLDVEEIAKAKRTFDEQYSRLKQKEESLQEDAAFLHGGLTSTRSELHQATTDMREFKDIYKRYTNQLVKVKMSDMANSDLEKYAKALDSAIMKYHTLKMEELNDTMKHLWNKTYQGTDIDGIKIRSDVEGGASKRSYNYRVVMTKDQVEMDMRGRCSAGQKMLASIIIRLALSDSFGQNCGILALDEPTNALDTENIDALASSLVDIINERKDHSNFQLLIITHDENFLRKLGQNDVMEHYWRVSRDARQKSVIERQRFR